MGLTLLDRTLEEMTEGFIAQWVEECPIHENYDEVGQRCDAEDFAATAIRALIRSGITLKRTGIRPLGGR